MNDGSSDEADDPHLLLLGRIAGELRGIRLELAAMNDDAPNASSNHDRFACRCGEVVTGESAAKTHAKTEHKAPDGAWEHLFERNDEP